MENRPALLGEFLDEALAGRAEPLRLVAQTLAGPVLSGEEARLVASRGVDARTDEFVHVFRPCRPLVGAKRR
jgi:hypothetical protein